MTTARPEARYVKAGELLAMAPSALHAGPSGMFWMFGAGAAQNERRGNVAVVHVRGGLDHHADSWDDNYESIVKRVGAAMSGQDVCDAYDREHKYEADYQPMQASPPNAVMMCIDSPGGVVSGLNECVFALQRLAKESGVRLVAFVNEMAASAAYALCCACDQVLAPPSAIIGSIGVISTMISQDARNKKEGFDVRLLTSGARKADGHLHAPITDGAVAAEQARVDKLAQSFFKIASKARGLSIATIEGFQAGIYLGADAERRGLIDETISLDDAIMALSGDAPGSVKAGGNETIRRAASKNVDAAHKHGSQPTAQVGTGDSPMLKLTALIQKTKAAIATEDDPEKLSKLAADLAAYKKTEKHIEHTKSEEHDDPSDEDEDDPDKEDDEEDAKKAESGSEESGAEEENKASAKGEVEEEDEEDSKKASAALAFIESATGKKGNAALGAMMAKMARLDQYGADVEKLKADAVKTERSALIKRAGKYVPKHLLAAIQTQKISALRAFVAEAEKGSPMVHTEEGDLIVPKATTPGTEASLPKDTLELIEQAVLSCGLKDTKAFRAKLVESHLKAHTDRLQHALNGAGRI